MRPTELRMTPAAPHDEDSRATRSRSHTRTSVQQQRLPTVIRSARTVSQVTSNAARGRAQSSGEREHLVVVYTSEHLRVITVNQLCRPSRLFSRMVSTRHRCANVAHNSVLQNVLCTRLDERPNFSKRRFAPVCRAVPCRTGRREFAAHLNLTCACTSAQTIIPVLATQTGSLIGYEVERCLFTPGTVHVPHTCLTLVCAPLIFDISS